MDYVRPLGRNQNVINPKRALAQNKMAFVKIWIHAVWGTKKRYPYLINDVKSKVIAHIKDNAKQKNIFIDSLNGYHEHLHCLFCLNTDMSISKAMQLIKGESSFWINKEKITKEKFEWADEYYAVSVSDSQIDKVRSYIKNQDTHHKKTTYEEEYKNFIESYGGLNEG